MLALSRGDVCHCGATLCFAALLARAACEHMSLIRQQQWSLSLLHRKGTSPNLSPGSAPQNCRAVQMVRGEKGIAGNILAARWQQSMRDSSSQLSQNKPGLYLACLKKTVDSDSGEREAPFVCMFYFKSRENISSEMQTQGI